MDSWISEEVSKVCQQGSNKSIFECLKYLCGNDVRFRVQRGSPAWWLKKMNKARHVCA